MEIKAYLDNASTTKVATEVEKAIKDAPWANPGTKHWPGKAAKKAMYDARQLVASRLGADSDEIVFTSGGTESDNLAILGAARANKGNHVITAKTEHKAVLGACKQLEQEGDKVTYLSVDRNGFIDIDELESAITNDTVLVSIMHVNNETGTIQPVEEIAKICKAKGVLFHTDAVQGFTKLDLDLSGIDLMSMSSHKIHGPKGVGALYVKKGTKLAAIMYGGKHELGLRPGTENVPGIVGFATAVELAKPGDAVAIKKLRCGFAERLLEIPDSFLNGPEERVCHILNIGFKGIDAQELMQHLDARGICVSAGAACAEQSIEPSHVLKAIGLSDEDAKSSIRFSLSRYTTKEELGITVAACKEIVEKLRSLQ
ncbi:cysteine desulfurase family protein [Nanoarchaeota archaeon]